MKSTLTMMSAVAFLFAGSFVAGAQDTKENTKTTTANRTMKTSTDTIYGKVESYEASKTLKVSVPGKISATSSKSFDLDEKNATVHVPDTVKVGDWVKVVEKTDNSGHKTLTVTPSTEKEAMHTKKTS
jgi:ribosomal protein S17